LGKISSKFTQKAVRDHKTRQHIVPSDYVGYSYLIRKLAEVRREMRDGTICPECREPLRPEAFARVTRGEDLVCDDCGLVIRDARKIMRSHRGITKGRGR